MSVQRWTADGYGAQQGEMMPDPEGPWMLAADHARIVAEAGAAVFAFHPEWTVTGMCDSDCLACRRLTELITEREKGYEEGKADAEQEHAAALAEATDRQRARDYVSLWSRLMLEDRKYRAALARAAIVIRQRLTDSDVFRLTGQSVRLHEWETVKPLPADKAAAPRTLTADDPEPAVGAVVLLAVGNEAVQRSALGWQGYAMHTMQWAEMFRFGPVTLIHDGGAA